MHTYTQVNGVKGEELKVSVSPVGGSLLSGPVFLQLTQEDLEGTKLDPKEVHDLKPLKTPQLTTNQPTNVKCRIYFTLA